jgi:hypothetical protein
METGNKYSSLHDAVVSFLGILLKCLNGTSYPIDRTIYLQDIAAAASWVVDLNQGAKPKLIAEKITSTSTNKLFGDYFRQGEFGDLEAEALKNLQDYAKGFL